MYGIALSYATVRGSMGHAYGYYRIRQVNSIFTILFACKTMLKLKKKLFQNPARFSTFVVNFPEVLDLTAL